MSKGEMEGLVVSHFHIKTIKQVRTIQNHCLETPDGGDGGDGGDVFFRSTGRLSSLYDLRRAHFYGNNAKNGMVIRNLTILYSQQSGVGVKGNIYTIKYLWGRRYTILRRRLIRRMTLAVR